MHLDPPLSFTRRYSDHCKFKAPELISHDRLRFYLGPICLTVTQVTNGQHGQVNVSVINSTRAARHPYPPDLGHTPAKAHRITHAEDRAWGRRYRSPRPSPAVVRVPEIRRLQGAVSCCATTWADLGSCVGRTTELQRQDQGSRNARCALAGGGLRCPRTTIYISHRHSSTKNFTLRSCAVGWIKEEN